MFGFIFVFVLLTSSRTSPNLDHLFGIAVGQAGYFTAAQAREAGYSLQLLQHHLKRGNLERSGRGIFRFVRFPASAEEGLVVPWLWSERRGVVSHESALQFHDLADAMPAQVHLTLPAADARRRLRVPPNVSIAYADVPAGDLTQRGPVPVTSALRTLRDCIDAHVTPEWLQPAIDRGLQRGLFTRVDLANLRLPPGVTVPSREAA
jgi:predicted transcriptional regulator of viral defense system